MTGSLAAFPGRCPHWASPRAEVLRLWTDHKFGDAGPVPASCTSRLWSLPVTCPAARRKLSMPGRMLVGMTRRRGRISGRPGEEGMHDRSRSAGEAHAENHVRPRSSAARGNSAQHGPRGRTRLSLCSGMRISRRRERVWPARKVTQSQTSHEAAEPLGRPSCLA